MPTEPAMCQQCEHFFNKSGELKKNKMRGPTDSNLGWGEHVSMSGRGGGAGMVQSVKSMPCTHQDPSLITRTHVKNGVEWSVCVTTGLGRQRQ